MKPLLSCILTVFLFLTPFRQLLPTAAAQGWTWGRQGTSAKLDAWQVATDAFGNVYAGGMKPSIGTTIFGSYTIPGYTVGVSQSIWVKYNSSGTLLWADGSISGSIYLDNITTDPSGNLILFGSFSSLTAQIGAFTLSNPLGPGGPQYFLAKVSPSGTVLWAISEGNTITNVSIVCLTEIMGMGGVTTDAAGNIYVTASFNQKTTKVGPYTLTNADPTGTTYDILVAKYTPAGTLVWASSIGGAKDDYGIGITVSSTGNVYIAGAFSSPSLSVGSSVLSNPYKNPLACIAEFSPSGVPLWAQSAGGSNGALATAIASDKSGNVYMTGGFQDPSISFGTTTITRPFTGVAPRLSAFLTGYSSSNVVTWSKCIGSPTQYVTTYSVAVAACGQVWVSGAYTEKAVIDPGDTLAFPYSWPANDPVFIAGYNLSGGVAGYASLASGGDDQNEIAVDPVGNVYLCSDFYPPTFTVGPDVLTGTTNEYFYLAKYLNNTDTTIYKDTSLCLNTGSATLTAPPGYTTYYWDDGSTTTTRTVTTGGKYYVRCMTCGAPILVDSFIVSTPDSTFSHTDTSTCSLAGSMTINAPAGYSSYLWNTGSTASSITITGFGSYWVRATKDCSIQTETYNVTANPLPVVALGNDITFCQGNTITLKAPQVPGYSYLWNTGSTSDSISTTEGGTYWLTVNNYGCMATDSINITRLSPPPAINLGPDTTLCLGDVIQLSAQVATAAYLWSTGSNEHGINVTETGTYWTTVSNQCGITSDTIKVDFEPCDIWFPSAFSPNDDGRNDIFRAVGTFTFFKYYSLSIYNRWGQRVFITEDIYSGWDGTYNGAKQDLGTYFYMAHYTLEGKKHMMKGDFQLIR